MIIISDQIQQYFNSSKDLHIHDFEKPLDIDTWQPKLIILSPQLKDLLALPEISNYTDVSRLILLDHDTVMHFGSNIDGLIQINDADITCSACPNGECQRQLKKYKFSSVVDQDSLQQLETDFTKTHRLLTDGIYIICGSYRLGTATFVTHLEYEIAIPNDTDFDLFMITYQNYRYIVVGISNKYLDRVQKLADSLGLKLASGKPLSSNADKITHFPFSYAEDSTFTLESAVPLVCSDQNLIRQLGNERREINNYLNEKMKKYDQDINVST